MKRLNPETGKPFKQGDTREDGFLFWCYRKSIKLDGFFNENWCSITAYESHLIKRAAWKKLNSEKLRKYCRDYRKSNLHKDAARVAKRKSLKNKRTPIWLTQEHLKQIESVYALAKQLTAKTGVLHHVDHIIPLQGKTVSGLHVPWNLRAIPATENLCKSNRLL